MMFVYDLHLLIKICSTAILVNADNPLYSTKKYHCLVRLGGEEHTHLLTLQLFNLSSLWLKL